MLGKYNLEKEERNEIKSNVDKIYVNPDWVVQSQELDADLAILVLNLKVSFTKYIRPVCLPSGDDEQINRLNGAIAGWGLIDNLNTPATVLKHANISVMDAAICLTRDKSLAQISSKRTFCALGDGSPNEGDSGGGFFTHKNRRWVQYGIVSSIRANARGEVEDGAYSVYTNIREFKDWIDRMINFDDQRLVILPYINLPRYQYLNVYETPCQ